MDAGWFAAIGAAGVAGVGGVFELAKRAMQSRDDRAKRTHDANEAKAARDAAAALAEAQRTADAAEKTAQREHDRHAAERAERNGQIREWRAGLETAHAAFAKWEADQKAIRDGTLRRSSPTPQPNIVGAVWFQSLRPHLSDDRSLASLRGDNVECDDDNADKIGHEITRIGREWLSE